MRDVCYEGSVKGIYKETAVINVQENIHIVRIVCQNMIVVSTLN